MAENKLYITISDNRSGQKGGQDGDATPTSGNKGDKKDNSGNAATRYAEHQLFNLAKRTAVQSVNFAISNIGNLTGDYIAQRNVGVAKQAISGVISVGMSTAGGAAVGGWVGAIVGFSVGVVSLIGSSVQSEIQNRLDTAKQNLEIAQLRDRAGLNATYDGSRGTEN